MRTPRIQSKKARNLFSGLAVICLLALLFISMSCTQNVIIVSGKIPIPPPPPDTSIVLLSSEKMATTYVKIPIPPPPPDTSIISLIGNANISSILFQANAVQPITAAGSAILHDNRNKTLDSTKVMIEELKSGKLVYYRVKANFKPTQDLRGETLTITVPIKSAEQLYEVAYSLKFE